MLGHHDAAIAQEGPVTRRFSVGELVVMQHASYHDEFNGAPGVIVGGLAPRRALDLTSMRVVTVTCYDVQVLVAPSRKVLAAPYQLRPLGGDGQAPRVNARATPVD
jgi:hypothetical protein